MAEVRVELGAVVATPAALEALEHNSQGPGEFLARHRRGDWGEVDEEDRAANDWAAREGGRLLSVYKLKDGSKLWVITEWDRSATTLLLPEDY